MIDRRASGHLRGRCGKRVIVFQLFLAMMWGTLPAHAAQTWVIGGEEHPWAESGDMQAVDAVSDLGWIQPIRTTRDQNLALGDEDRVSRAYSLQPSIQTLGGLDKMIDGDSTTAFVMTLEATVGSSVILDLGAVFPVSLIKFYPRQDERHKENFLRAYQVYVTDRQLTAQGQILWDLVAPNWDNDQSVVKINIPNRYVRDVRIQAVTNLQWEIAEWEVYGQGFAPSATFTSDPIDLGGAANFGDISWAVTEDPTASITLVTRSGTDSTPYTYYRFDRPEEGVVDTVEVTRAVYEELAEKDRYRVFDVDHWSFWSAPYAATGKEAIVSPAPRRYFQFQIQFQSQRFTDRARVDSVVIEYSSPPIARRVLGEVHPSMVPAGERTRFVYAVMPEIAPGDRGFDALTITTPLAAQVEDLRIDGVSVPYDAEVSDEALTVTFPGIRRNGTLLEVEFDCQVLVYGTVFSGTVFDTRRDELPQDVEEGNASSEITGNSLSVGVTELSSTILSGLAAVPGAFTPNGDGVNDHVTIQYHLQKLLLPGRVEIQVWDLAGRSVWQETVHQASGVYGIEWDGRDLDGTLVPPGTYVFTITVHTASGRESKVGTVGVAY